MDKLKNEMPGEDNPPDRSARITNQTGWYPDLNPTQRKIFEDPSDNLLAYGEKGSGKTIALSHGDVRHCYENANAFCIIISPSIFTGKEGVWHDIDEMVLPQWKAGMGLEYTDTKLDPETKDRTRWIGNRHGGWSKLVLKSVPYAAAVEARIKGPAPSRIHVEEITNCDGIEYFTFPSFQLGRRRGIDGPQQYVASCNPEGQSHWVYKVFFIDCVNQETGVRDKDYAVYHVPIEENRHRLPTRYLESLEKRLRDPIERRRLLDGEWIDRPSGDAIFKEYFLPNIHVRGDAAKGQGLIPHKGTPIIIGHDPGPVNYSATMMQLLNVKGKLIWIVFDEINLVGQYVPYFKVVPKILKRMDYWSDKLGSKVTFEHIADDASFTQVRTDGSFDAAEIQKLSKGRIKFKGCPKGRETVPARVRMVMSMFLDETIYISAICPRTIDMFTNLTSKVAKIGDYDPLVGFRPQKSSYSHSFDSLSYPPFYFSMRSQTSVTATDAVEPSMYSCGRS